MNAAGVTLPRKGWRPTGPEEVILPLKCFSFAAENTIAMLQQNYSTVRRHSICAIKRTRASRA
ncbi:hypothetical protein TIFTF001_017061 [Ficus carica]|uniref:Uncharacterized protein n=1 Tax=Ficus carica TaxID=3494 RepID=A0AA88A9W4_FICCA|nr:hypothetical protein TIFTF001_017061 [Ficus carica]